jgi:hypothetical protein
VSERNTVASTEVATLSVNGSRGVVVLHKCVNPVCAAQFRFLHQGKLFEVEIHHRDKQSGNGQRAPPGSGKAHIERYWLCDRCMLEVELQFDGLRGLVVRSQVGSEPVFTPVSTGSGRPVTDVSRVLIRPLDLNVRPKRNFMGKLNMQTRDAA